MPNPFRRFTSFFQDRVTGFTREINNTFSTITGRRQTPVPEEILQPTPETPPQPFAEEETEKPGSFLGFVKSVVTSPFTQELSQTAAQKSTKLTENAVFVGSMLVGHVFLGPLGAIGLGVGVNFLQNRNKGNRQTLGKTAFAAAGIAVGSIAGAGLGAALGTTLGPLGTIVGSSLGAAAGGYTGRSFGFRFSSAISNIFGAVADPRPSSFVTITSNLTSIILLPITIPFDLFIKPLLVGCLILIALVLSAIFLVFALFIIPNPQTTGSPTGAATKPGLGVPPPLTESCAPSLSPFGNSSLDRVAQPFTGTQSCRAPNHPGVDLGGSGEVFIRSTFACEAQVAYAGYDDAYGNYVVLKGSDNFYTFFAHLAQTPPVSTGQIISPNTVIGIMGNTGNSDGIHLHYEVRQGTNVDPQSNCQPNLNLNPCDYGISCNN